MKEFKAFLTNLIAASFGAFLGALVMTSILSLWHVEPGTIGANLMMLIGMVAGGCTLLLFAEKIRASKKAVK